MKNVKHLLLLMFLSSVMMVGGYAQDGDDKYHNVPNRLQDQKDEYDDMDYLFPPQPKSNWSIGIKGGLAYVAGDVKARPGLGFGIDVRKAMGHIFGLRFQATGGQTKGQNYQLTNGYKNHQNNPWDTNYFTDRTTTPPSVFYNFQMRYFDVGLQGVVNLNNINFYKEQNKWNIFASAGIGLMAYNTKVDALNANGEIYDFSSVPNFTTVSDRRDILDAINSLQDGVYETPAEGHVDEQDLTLSGDNYIVNPFVSGSVGFRYRISRRLELEVEHRIAWSNDDLLDGQRWQEAGGGGNFPSSQTSLTRDFDSYNHTTLGVHFRLGSGEESLWWTNPLTEAYSSAAEARELVRKLSDDADNDGVPDLYDKEPDTPLGLQVDASGRTLDSDGDGYPDSEDDEPFSPKGSAVDSRGVALDSDADGVPDIFDKEPGSAPGALVDAKGIAIPTFDPALVNASAPCILPIIHFDLNKDEIKPEFYPELYYIAQVMKNDENVTVKATGHTDVRNTDEYNVDLSMRRVNNAVDFMINTYGIDPSRFDRGYDGENNTVIKNLPDNHANRKLEPLHYVNRRVEFECVRP